MDIYIDVETGTWGDTESLRFLSDPDSETLSILAESSDAEIIDIGYDSGEVLEDYAEGL